MPLQGTLCPRRRRLGVRHDPHPRPRDRRGGSGGGDMVRGDGGTGRGDIGTEEQGWGWTEPGEGQRARECAKHLVPGGLGPVEGGQG